jgi:hypothetical protein
VWSNVRGLVQRPFVRDGQGLGTLQYMRLVLQRQYLTEISTIGEIRINGNHECYTLELPIIDGLPGSAIPSGIFSVKVYPSPKFQMSMDPWIEIYARTIPHIMGIPHRSLILIHWGNTAKDTDGCILVGRTRGENYVGASRAAFGALHAKIASAVRDPLDGCEIQVMA